MTTIDPNDQNTGDPSLELADFEPTADDFARDLLEGLRRPGQKTAPCMYLYDRPGSLLFDQICELDEYYPTRTEIAIYELHARAIAEAIGPGAMIVEPGSGNGDKGMLLLEKLDDPAAFVPVEISREHLLESAHRIKEAFPDVEVLPVCADFGGEYHLPEPARPVSRAVIYFPGSTIGNFEPDARADLLRSFAEHARECPTGRGGLLIGFDLVKPESVLIPAYDDARGVTAAFNMNLLHRANRELDADFDIDNWKHEARWNPDHQRIEMHLVSLADQTATIRGEQISFAKGESIHTENSHKFTIERFAELARAAGMELVRAFTDDEKKFAVGWFETAK